MEDWQRYRPQHELPADVQTLPRDETVCKFCGVSYLIHNEIKKLEEKVQFLERQLQHYEGYDRREEELKKKLEDTLNEKGEAGLKLEKERTRYARYSWSACPYIGISVSVCMICLHACMSAFLSACLSFRLCWLHWRSSFIMLPINLSNENDEVYVKIKHLMNWTRWIILAE